MDILFKTTKLRKLCNSDKELRRKYGPREAKTIRKRLDILAAAENLGVLYDQPGLGRCHELTGDYSGQLSLDLVHPYRLLFEPADRSSCTKSDGGLDWKKVTRVTIIGMEDTHG